MIVVAGPPGGGKSTAFPVAGFGVGFFNADDRAAELNQGSYRNIPPHIRAQVNSEFEAFVQKQIQAGTSLAFETTLRTDITLRQAAEARARGFSLAMKYVAMGSLEEHLNRVAARAQGGGHAASSSSLSRIYHASLANLPAALRTFDDVEVFDNAEFGQAPRLVLECQSGQLTFVAEEVPAWLHTALRGTEFEVTQVLRSQVNLKALARLSEEKGE
jgi:predicted ABC-type ATPase